MSAVSCSTVLLLLCFLLLFCLFCCCCCFGLVCPLYIYLPRMLSVLLLFYVFCCRGCSGLVCPFYICTRCLFCCYFTCFVVACILFVLSIPAQGVAGFDLKALEHPHPGSLVPGKQVPSLHTQFCLSLCY